MGCRCIVRRSIRCDTRSCRCCCGCRGGCGHSYCGRCYGRCRWRRWCARCGQWFDTFQFFQTPIWSLHFALFVYWLFGKRAFIAAFRWVGGTRRWLMQFFLLALCTCRCTCVQIKQKNTRMNTNIQLFEQKIRIVRKKLNMFYEYWWMMDIALLCVVQWRW